MKLSVYLFFIWLIVEGILRKWVFPGLATHLFFVKYILLLIPVFHVLTSGVKLSKKEYPFYILILLYFVWGFFEIANPRLTSDLRVKLLGVMIHFAFIPLIYIVPYVLTSKDKILNILKILVIISIPIFILGVIQYYSPTSSFINKYVSSDAHIARVGVHVRVTGVFSYLAPYVTYLILTMSVILTLAFMGNSSKLMNIVLITAGALGIVNIYMTGSRGALYTFVGIAVSFLMLYTYKNLFKKKKTVITALFLAFAGYLILMQTDIGKTSVEQFQNRERESGGIQSRLIDNFTPFKYLDQAGLVGYGIGATYQGAARYVKDWKNMPRNYEEEPERILLEIGLVGFLILTFLRINIFYFSWKSFKKVKDRELKILCLLLFLYQIPAVLGVYTVLYNWLQNALYWIVIGLIVAINRIDKLNYVRRFSHTPR